MIDALNEDLAAHIFPDRGDGSEPRSCPTCGTGRLSLKLGRFGSFVGCSNYPECRFTRQLGTMARGDAEALGTDGVKLLGTDPVTSLDVTLRSGRFGPYVQLGEEGKPKRASLPKGWTVESIDLARACTLLSLPRLVGEHPETGKPDRVPTSAVTAPMSATTAPMPTSPRSTRCSRSASTAPSPSSPRRRNAADAVAPRGCSKSFGEHPASGGEITVRDGRYGPYVAWGKVYATLPKGKDPQALTLEEAVALIADKAGKANRPRRLAPRPP